MEMNRNQRTFRLIRNGVLAACAGLAVLCLNSGLRGAESSLPQLAADYTKGVRPLLKRFCLKCHSTKEQKGELDLERFQTLAAVRRNASVWIKVRDRLSKGEMPPEGNPRPSKKDSRQLLDWVRSYLNVEARQRAGDPGPVLARRLSNAEYDDTIHDLTGVDIRPTREFPIDPANKAGFDNSGESLAMSPALLKKYLAAARLVADHVVLKPRGFVFAPHPAVTETDRDKYAVRRIIDFYARHRVDYADYCLAAWEYRYRKILGLERMTFAALADARRISPKYLRTIWMTLEESKHETGPLAELQALWRKLPAPTSTNRNEVRKACEAMRDFVLREREKVATPLRKVSIRGIAGGSQPIVLWMNRQLAAGRMRYIPAKKDADDLQPDRRAALERFCAVFPDKFMMTERARLFLGETRGNKGRLLSAGFHLMMGYFRDDQPLYTLVLNDKERKEIDKLWRELNFITLAPMRQYKDFVFFERAEPPRTIREAAFDFARSEDKDVVSQAKIDRLSKLYQAKAKKNGATGEAAKAVEDYFKNIAADIRWVERARKEAEPSHLRDLLTFAERAYRRPLSKTERNSLLDFYHLLRTKDGLGHEVAIRDSIVGILMSPHFCYRIALPPAGTGVKPLSDYALASRLSYFLWSSLPDKELLTHAAAGDLHTPQVLAAQTRRMLKDPKIGRLATEFGGNWLGFRRFEQHNSVDRRRFPEFTDKLRTAMYEEPIRFLTDVAQRDRSVLDLLYAKHTFVNPVLAKHYGMPVQNVKPGEWVRIDDADRYGRGGLLPMAVFLTANSPGLRTSPVKRGYWVVRNVLGETIPAPPPSVPELPKDESKLGDLTLRQVLEQHRSVKSCASCHRRFDSIGLVFEAYGPVGERRTKDLGGRPVDTRVTFPSGISGEGVTGLRDYVKQHRQDDFLDNLCRKLLTYALSRSLILSDEPAIERMKANLKSSGYRFGGLVETIVSSPQFRNQRGRDYNSLMGVSPKNPK
jgi:Protein of unknown function (DUF1592)/Protein of unknown function (DUF1588)/Protein of unknown function (DUF1587)/Protein of unknown function (DUF1585)/Protein of unknown function (DUF1595)/Planctomycete cytochrome C